MQKTVEYSSTVYGLKFKGNIVYVGSTKKALNTRLGEHYQMAMRGAPNKLHTWIRENKPALTIIELERTSAANRFERETFFMMQHRTIEEGFNTEIATNIGRPKGCKNPTGSDHYQYGKPMPAHITEASRRAHLGKPISEEHKRKLRHGAIAAGNSQKRVRRSDGVEFPSMKAAAQALGVTGEAVGVACKKGTTCKGYKFEKI